MESFAFQKSQHLLSENRYLQAYEKSTNEKNEITITDTFHLNLFIRTEN